MSLETFFLFSSVDSFYLYHAICSLLIGIISLFFLKKKFTTSKVKMVLFIFIFNMALPIVGYLLTVWLVYYLLNVKYKKELNHINYVDMVAFENEFPEVKRIFGDGSMDYLMFDERAESSLRMKALVSLADNASKKELRLIKNTLSDKNDEMRLYSFAIIDHKERIINEKIHHQMQIFHKAASSEQIISAAEELVYLYWDMIYFELSDSDLQYFLIEEIEKYAEVVLKEKPYHGKINIVLGKMYLMKENFDKAEKYFKIAIETGVDKDFIIPYLAEILYNKRDFSSIKTLLGNTEKLHLNSMLNPVIMQWNM